MVRWFLLSLLLFVMATALPGGVLLALYPDGSILQMPAHLLNNTPFTSFLIPGLVLAVVVGGSAVLALVQVWRHHMQAWRWALASGIVLCGWISVQILLLGVISVLQYSYLGLGLVITGLAWCWRNILTFTPHS